MNTSEREERLLAYIKDAELRYKYLLDKSNELAAYYSTGWVQKPARVNCWGLIDEVWKNTAVQNDAGQKAREFLSEFKE